jgi:hypothetical protein
MTKILKRQHAVTSQSKCAMVLTFENFRGGGGVGRATLPTRCWERGRVLRMLLTILRSEMKKRKKMEKGEKRKKKGC